MPDSTAFRCMSPADSSLPSGQNLRLPNKSLSRSPDLQISRFPVLRRFPDLQSKTINSRGWRIAIPCTTTILLGPPPDHRSPITDYRTVITLSYTQYKPLT